MRSSISSSKTTGRTDQGAGPGGSRAGSRAASQAAARQERDLRRRIRSSLADWAGLALEPTGQVPAPHHRLLMAELEKVARGTTRRLMVQMPPGAAKSTYASILFPAWWLARRPESSIIAACHTLSLAEHFGRSLRGLVSEHGPRLGYALEAGNRAARRFATDAGGQYFATGTAGPMVGRRADLVLIDDPIKSQAEADSRAHRDRLWEWFRADLTTRLKPQGRIVLIMTRWHPDDLAGRLLDEAAADRRAAGWTVLRLPALAEAGDPLGRAPGTPLWPEWEDADSLAARRAALGERSWAALYQQRPRLREGGLFAIDRLPVLDAAETEQPVRSVRAWDLAATAGHAGDPDWTVGIRLSRTPTGRYVIDDLVRLRGGPGAVEAAIRATAERDGKGVAIGLPQDPGQAGRAQIAYLTRQLAGFRVHGSPESGSKETRAMPVASQADAGNLALLRAPWNRTLLEELRDFPHGAKDDQVDALSRAFGMLADAQAAPARRTNVGLLVR